MPKQNWRYYNYFCSFLAVLFWVSLPLHAQSVVNSQQLYGGAELMGLGGHVPTLQQCIQGAFINPASISGIQGFRFNINQQSTMDDFQYLSLGSSIPVGPFTMGLLYGSVSLEGIPLTLIDNNRIRPIGSYRAADQTIFGTLAVELNNIVFADQLDVGFQGKVFEQIRHTHSRQAFSGDLGAIYTLNIPWGPVNRTSIGGSVLNIIPTTLTYKSISLSDTLPRHFFFGIRTDLSDHKTSLFAQTFLADHSFGISHQLHPNLSLLGSYTNQNLACGIGLNIFDVTGPDNQKYHFKLDYSYVLNSNPITRPPNHIFSLTLLSQDVVDSSKITSPKPFTITNKERISIVGIGPSQTALTLFQNGLASYTTKTNNRGKWAVDNVPLRPGKNQFITKTYSTTSKIAATSKKHIVYLDQSPPILSPQVIVSGNIPLIVIESNESLSALNGKIGPNLLTFVKTSSPKYWETVLPPQVSPHFSFFVPSTQVQFQVQGTDLRGNVSDWVTFSSFIVSHFPENGHVSYYSEIPLIGEVSSQIISLKINHTPVALSENGHYEHREPLALGTNTIHFELHTKQQLKQNYTLRIYRLKTFSDLKPDLPEKDTIETLATLGVFKNIKTANFHPKKPILRSEFCQFLVLYKNLSVLKSEKTPFKDVNPKNALAPYIYTAQSAGYINGFPGNLFKPNVPVTMTQAAILLERANILEKKPRNKLRSSITWASLATLLSESAELKTKIDQLLKVDRTQ